jgi:hypothetical protein
VVEGRSIYVIALRGDRSHALSDVERADFHGVPCLTGTGHYVGEYERLNGRPVFVPLSEIQSVTEYPSEADYRTAMNAADVARRKAGRGKKLLWTALIVIYLLVMGTMAVASWFRPPK